MYTYRHVQYVRMYTYRHVQYVFMYSMYTYRHVQYVRMYTYRHVQYVFMYSMYTYRHVQYVCKACTHVDMRASFLVLALPQPVLKLCSDSLLYVCTV